MKDWRRLLAVVAVVLGALAIARLADAAGKRELARTARDVAAELAEARAEHGELAARADGLEQDQLLLEQRLAFLSKREHYLVINRRRLRLRLFLGDKEMLDIGFRLRGPSDRLDVFGALPAARLEVLGKRLDTDWYKPDWLYRLEGVEPPEDPDERLVRNAFGPGELHLGGAIAIHGAARGGVPAEAIDHVWIELDDESLKAVVLAVEPGAKVLIE